MVDHRARRIRWPMAIPRSVTAQFGIARRTREVLNTALASLGHPTLGS